MTQAMTSNRVMLGPNMRRRTRMSASQSFVPRPRSRALTAPLWDQEELPEQHAPCGGLISTQPIGARAIHEGAHGNRRAEGIRAPGDEVVLAGPL